MWINYFFFGEAFVSACKRQSLMWCDNVTVSNANWPSGLPASRSAQHTMHLVCVSTSQRLHACMWHCHSSSESRREEGKGFTALSHSFQSDNGTKAGSHSQARGVVSHSLSQKDGEGGGGCDCVSWQLSTPLSLPHHCPPLPPPRVCAVVNVLSTKFYLISFLVYCDGSCWSLIFASCDKLTRFTHHPQPS